MRVFLLVSGGMRSVFVYLSLINAGTSIFAAATNAFFHASQAFTVG